MLRYYLLVLRVALRPSWEISDIIGGVLGLTVPVAVKYVPEEARGSMSELVWEVPLCALLTLFLVRVVFAPWLIHKEQQAKLDMAQVQLADKTQELHHAQTADPNKNAIRAGIEDRIRRFEGMASRASTHAIPAGEFYPLEQEADNYLRRQS